MTPEARTLALRVKPGDHVRVRGTWREVRATRPIRDRVGVVAVVLILTTDTAWWCPATLPVRVRRRK
ncbi:hypothetical protein [Streptomyces sp. TRM64462]|uniref:hypothetical protein n=1 Tax=Streptomyces sp. TRM64462 TaxID=2741726 RepID=UPI0015865171|nr:hypothetical protein [Streptomyces sp. TRM64462]